MVGLVGSGALLALCRGFGPRPSLRRNILVSSRLPFTRRAILLGDANARIPYSEPWPCAWDCRRVLPDCDEVCFPNRNSVGLGSFYRLLPGSIDRDHGCAFYHFAAPSAFLLLFSVVQFHRVTGARGLLRGL